MSKERDDAKKQANNYNTLARKLQDEVQEQLSAIDSLVDLLERQGKDHAKQLAERDDQIAALEYRLLGKEVLLLTIRDAHTLQLLPLEL